ncbi:MAG: type II secretion system protein [Isosphaeraceae bacterium]|nr:type II secretion system protein [Isosphaeraceae bacterium]
MNRSGLRSQRGQGFSLIELLVVIAFNKSKEAIILRLPGGCPCEQK